MSQLKRWNISPLLRRRPREHNCSASKILSSKSQHSEISSMNDLKHACDRKDLNSIKTIIVQSPNLINEVIGDSSENTLLMKACIEGWEEIVRDLISNHSGTINIIQEGDTALHIAVSSGRLDCMRKLLSHPHAPINVQNKSGFTPLKLAVYSDRVDCLKELLSHPDLNINTQNKQGNTALYQAVSSGKVDSLRELLSHPHIDVNIQNKCSHTALYVAVSSGSVNSVRELLSHPQIDVAIKCGEFKKTVLWYCKNRDCYDLLLPHYPKMKEDKKRMAWIWSMYNHNEGSVVKLKEITQQFSKEILYEMKDDVSMLVWIAAGRGDKDMTEFLLYSFGDIIDINIHNEFGNTALHRAVRCGSVDCLKALLSHPLINIHLENKNGNDAYYQAIVSDKEDCARELRSHPHFK